MTEYRDPVCSLVETNDETRCGVHQTIFREANLFGAFQQFYLKWHQRTSYGNGCINESECTDTHVWYFFFCNWIL